MHGNMNVKFPKVLQHTCDSSRLPIKSNIPVVLVLRAREADSDRSFKRFCEEMRLFNWN